MANIRRTLAVLLVVVLLIGCIPMTFAADSEDFGISSAFLRLNEDINVVYTAKVPAGATNPRMVFTMCGISCTVSNYTVGDDGKYCFTFPKVTAVHMADNISATLYANYGGKTLTDTVDTYSVKAYCERTLAKYGDDAALKTLLSDLLTYGAAAQTYIGYNTDALPTAGLDLTPSTYTAISGKKLALEGTKSDAADWASAALVLSNDLAVRFTFNAASVDGLTARVTIDGRTQDFTAFESAGEGKYSFIFRGIKATEFDDAVTAALYQGNTQVGRTLTYSVNTYICGAQACGVANLEALVKALYNYGAAAVAYTGSSADDPEQFVCDHDKCPVCGGCLVADCDCEKVDCCTPCICTSYTISEVEAIDGWIGNPGFEPTLETANAPVGSKWLLSGSEAWPVFVSGFVPFNIAKFADGCLHMWLYVEDASLLGDGQIELCSASAPEIEETSWKLMDLHLQSGWNELYLPFEDADQVAGGANLAAINYIRIYAGSFAANRIGIDKLEVLAEMPVLPYVIFGGESQERWLGNPGFEPTVETEGAPVGSKWLLSGTENWPVFFSEFTAFDISDYADGCLHMWMYVEDASLLGAGEIELSSAKAPDNCETSWPLTSLHLQTGWNELYLPFASANQVAGGADLTGINYIRIFAGFNAPSCFGIDKIEVLPETPVQPYVIFGGESVEAWIGNPGFAPTVETTDAPVGSKWLLSGNEAWPVFVSGFVPFDISAYADGCLHMWMYIEDASILGAGEIELSSASAPDNQETSWALMDLHLQTGWNELYLPFATANQVGGGANLAAINYIRIYAGSMSASRIGIDKIEVLPETPVQPYVIFGGETQEAWLGNPGFEPAVQTANAPVGSNWLLSGCENYPVLFSGFTPFDISAYADGYVHLWMYIEDASLLVGGEIELSSAYSPELEETSWALMDLNLQTGWNELYLPLATANKVGGETDLTQIDYIRIYAGFISASHFGIDKMEVVAEKP